jgi:hypothetical protein
MNMNFSDAFASEVQSVTLTLIDSDGLVTYQKTESGERLSADDYEMEIDPPAGTYDMVAWCTTNENNSYSFGDGASRVGLNCRLNSKRADDGSAYMDTALDDLFHGYTQGVELPMYTGDYHYDMSLVKNTNHVHILVQNLNGNVLNADDFEFTFTDNNGSMFHDNSVDSDDEDITYHACRKVAASATYEKPDIDDTRAASSMSAVVASIHTLRMLRDHDSQLVVRKTAIGDNRTVLSIPFVDYALLLKSLDRNDLDDQEYLDRQHEYNITFFIDDSDRWVNSYIYINSWRIVLNEEEL